jgi:hypothetical protein
MACLLPAGDRIHCDVGEVPFGEPDYARRLTACAEIGLISSRQRRRESTGMADSLALLAEALARAGYTFPRIS